jgi:hypothetical protein
MACSTGSLSRSLAIWIRKYPASISNIDGSRLV